MMDENGFLITSFKRKQHINHRAVRFTAKLKCFQQEHTRLGTSLLTGFLNERPSRSTCAANSKTYLLSQ